MGDLVGYKEITNIEIYKKYKRYIGDYMIRQILGEVSVPVANTEVQQVIENPGIVKTYLEKYMPSLISFLVQLVVAIVILLIGIKVIKSVVKIIKKDLIKAEWTLQWHHFLPI